MTALERLEAAQRDRDLKALIVARFFTSSPPIPGTEGFQQLTAIGAFKAADVEVELAADALRDELAAEHA